MAAKHPVVTKKKSAGREKASVRPSATPEVIVSPEESGSPPTSPAVFDPRLLLKKLNGRKARHQYQANERVFSQGDAADAVFYIERGKVKLTVVSNLGKEAVVAILPEGSFFGEGCLAGQPLRMATATALQRAAIIRVTKPAMVAMLHQEPEFAERFLAYLLSRNIRMEADLVDHLFNSSEQRLARPLLLMASFGQESKPISYTHLTL